MLICFVKATRHVGESDRSSFRVPVDQHFTATEVVSMQAVPSPNNHNSQTHATPSAAEQGSTLIVSLQELFGQEVPEVPSEMRRINAAQRALIQQQFENFRTQQAALRASGKRRRRW